MLVLSRRTDEEIVLPELGITLKVLRTKGNQVRLGITAPQDIAILRGELAAEMERESESNPGVSTYSASVSESSHACEV